MHLNVYIWQVTYEETADGGVTANTNTNSSSADEAVSLLKECREEVSMVAKKVASTSSDLQAANNEFTKKFSEINDQMEETMKELKSKVEEVKGDDGETDEDTSVTSEPM